VLGDFSFFFFFSHPWFCFGGSGGGTCFSAPPCAKKLARCGDDFLVLFLFLGALVTPPPLFFLTPVFLLARTEQARTKQTSNGSSDTHVFVSSHTFFAGSPPPLLFCLTSDGGFPVEVCFTVSGRGMPILPPNCSQPPPPPFSCPVFPCAMKQDGGELRPWPTKKRERRLSTRSLGPCTFHSFLVPYRFFWTGGRGGGLFRARIENLDQRFFFFFALCCLGHLATPPPPFTARERFSVMKAYISVPPTWPESPCLSCYSSPFIVRL